MPAVYNSISSSRTHQESAPSTLYRVETYTYVIIGFTRRIKGRRGHRRFPLSSFRPIAGVKGIGYPRTPDGAPRNAGRSRFNLIYNPFAQRIGLRQAMGPFASLRKVSSAQVPDAAKLMPESNPITGTPSAYTQLVESPTSLSLIRISSY
jgi:hypothetical protein